MSSISITVLRQGTYNDGGQETNGELDLLGPGQHVIVSEDSKDAIAAAGHIEELSTSSMHSYIYG